MNDDAPPNIELPALPAGRSFAGRVVLWNSGRGFGFLRVPGFRDLFFHVTGVCGQVERGDRVTFAVTERPDGRKLGADVERIDMAGTTTTRRL